MGNLLDTSWFQEQLENMEEDFSFLDSQRQVVDGVTLSEGVEFIPEFHSTELDLDRDVPDYDDVYDHSLDTIDPDEADIPGPAIGTYGYNDEDDFDTYCDEHPDFNAAINGHPDNIDYTGFDSFLEKNLIA